MTRLCGDRNPGPGPVSGRPAGRCKRPGAFVSAAGIVLALVAGGVSAGATSDQREPWNRGWAFYTDNDLFAFVSRDQQYTGGAALELAGRRAREYPVSLDPIVGVADRLSRFARVSRDRPGFRRHSLTVGLAAFTPEDISDPEPIRDDHPYGSLLVMGNTRQTVLTDRPVSYSSTFLLGLLGTNVAREFQNFFHDIGDTERAQGWSNQISDAGEPTFKYGVNRQALLVPPDPGKRLPFDVRSDQFASVGFNTQVGMSATVRWGRIRRPWWQWQAFQGDYLDFGSPTAHTGRAGQAGPEWFFWLGAAARVRLYNALLEGQFRDSEVTFSRSELRLLQGERVLGAAADVFETRWRTEFELRWRTREIPGAAGQAPVWGRISISRSW